MKNYQQCGNCIGMTNIKCESAREALDQGLEQTQKFDSDIAVMARQDMIRRVAPRIADAGCAFTVLELESQLGA